MNYFSIRMRLIYLPFLVIVASFILVYSSLDWLFLVKFELPVNEEVVHIWLPMLLPWIPVFIWLSPRIRLLVLKDKKGNLPFLYRFVAGFAIAIPTIIAQGYIVTATGTLTQLQNINEINATALSKYYKLKTHFVDKRNVAVYHRTETSGKYNETLEFYIDVACPILPVPDTSTKSYIAANANTPKAWLCYQFSKSISNRLSDDVKETEFKAFDTLVNNEFREKNFDQFVYLDRIGMNNRSKAYTKAIRRRIGNIKNPIILEAVDAPFEARNGDKLMWIFASSGIGAVVWFLMVLIPKMSTAELKKQNGKSSSSDWPGFRKAISIHSLAKSNFLITLIIIGLNLLVFVIMVFAGLGVISFDARDLLAWGADFRPKTIDGQWWRLLTSFFLHGGLMHLFMNMYGLFFVAIFLEPMLGRLKYASAYLICGIAASIVSIWWHPATISVGASGAIFGLYGVLTAMIIANKVNVKDRRSMLLISLPFIVINLLLGLSGGIDNAAHVGGLLCGLIIGCLFSIFANLPAEKQKKSAKITSPSV